VSKSNIFVVVTTQELLALLEQCHRTFIKIINIIMGQGTHI